MALLLSGYTVAQLCVPYACGGAIAWFGGDFAQAYRAIWLAWPWAVEPLFS
jgi:hypothetical protein